MVKFENALDVSPMDDGKNWIVEEDFYYDTDVKLTPTAPLPPPWPEHLRTQPWVSRDNGSWRICIPKGFVTDFASIPRPLWWIVGGPAEGKYRKIAPVHDGLYRTFGLASRAQADAVLLEGMKFLGCPWFQCAEIYSGVRVGGWCSYKGGL